MSLPGNQMLQHLDVRPTAVNENKVQPQQRKMKLKFTLQEHKILYTARSNVEKFYGTAKLHKLPTLETIGQLSMQPLISNIKTASY